MLFGFWNAARLTERLDEIWEVVGSNPIIPICFSRYEAAFYFVWKEVMENQQVKR